MKAAVVTADRDSSVADTSTTNELNFWQESIDTQKVVRIILELNLQMNTNNSPF